MEGGDDRVERLVRAEERVSEAHSVSQARWDGVGAGGGGEGAEGMAEQGGRWGQTEGGDQAQEEPGRRAG